MAQDILPDKRYQKRPNAADYQQLKQELETLKAKLIESRNEVKDSTLDEISKNVDAIGRVNLRLRKILKGHLAKVYALHWSTDSRHVV
ncbi:hypothetical protein, partial [Salmonella sp. s51228]|uniref:hypothetical protein n=1 Tax=Salmonella sp. s51228 TaxID=3159652 RepID=UPI0039807C4D